MGASTGLGIMGSIGGHNSQQAPGRFSKQME